MSGTEALGAVGNTNECSAFEITGDGEFISELRIYVDSTQIRGIETSTNTQTNAFYAGGPNAKNLDSESLTFTAARPLVGLTGSQSATQIFSLGALTNDVACY